MTLRVRLALAAGVVVAALIIAFGLIVVRQRSVLIDQLDTQLAAVATNVERNAIAFSDAPVDQRRGPNAPTGELWFAITDSSGTPSVIAAPLSDPELVPNINLATAPRNQPFSADSLDGPAVRAIVLDLGNDRTALAAVSIAPVDQAQRQMILTSAIALGIVITGLGIVWWWVDRLSITPIKTLTAATEDIAAGKRNDPIDHPPTSTEAGRLGAAFNTMVIARQTAEGRQRRFVADASHELRTPLTTLQGYAALHEQGGLTEPDQIDDAMRRIRSEANRMSTLVEELLVLASLDEQRPLQPTRVDVSLLLEDIGRDASAIQPERPVNLADIAPGLTIAADPHLLTQAITAITTNALRHTPHTAILRIEAAGQGSSIRIVIADSGPGIEPNQLDRLFDRFHRADPGRSRQHPGGTGLGLAIAKSAIEAHGGTIAVASTPEVGTEFTIDLPTTDS